MAMDMPRLISCRQCPLYALKTREIAIEAKDSRAVFDRERGKMRVRRQTETRLGVRKLPTAISSQRRNTTIAVGSILVRPHSRSLNADHVGHQVRRAPPPVRSRTPRCDGGAGWSLEPFWCRSDAPPGRGRVERRGEARVMAGSDKKLRSTAWFGHPDKDGFLHRSWMKNQGFPADLFDGRPVIGICNTFSELTPCNAHFRELAERVKRGVYEAGGFPLEFPVFSTGNRTSGRPRCCSATSPRWTSRRRSAAIRSTASC